MRMSSSCRLTEKLSTESFGWLDFVRAVYVCQKLEQAIRLYASPEIIDYINMLSSNIDKMDLFKGTKFAYNSSEESDDRLDQVLGLVIEAFSEEAKLSDDDIHRNDIIVCLNKLLYPKFHRQEDFLSSVRNGSMHRALISARMCESLLIDSISVRNCFSLLKIAFESGCQQFAHMCLECCLTHFSAAVDQDRVGFTQLPVEIIKYVLKHDCLTVKREEDVLAAISIWVEHDMTNRMNAFVDLFATGIRFSEIDYFSLADLVDSCDLITMNQQAIELAAHELIQKTMCTSRENALGLGTICRPRKPYHSLLFDSPSINNFRELIHSMIEHGNEFLHSFTGQENIPANIGNVFDGPEVFVSPTKTDSLVLPNKMLINLNGNPPTRSLSHLLQD